MGLLIVFWDFWSFYMICNCLLGSLSILWDVQFSCEIPDCLVRFLTILWPVIVLCYLCSVISLLDMFISLWGPWMSCMICDLMWCMKILGYLQSSCGIHDNVVDSVIVFYNQWPFCGILYQIMGSVTTLEESVSVLKKPFAFFVILDHLVESDNLW